MTPSERLPVTVLIAAKNEAANLQRCLEALSAFERVVVVDSLSSDATASIVQTCGAEIVQFHYSGGYPKKRQWAMESIGIATPWVLLIDADEVVSAKLLAEISDTILGGTNHSAFLITKAFHFMGRRFRFGGFSHSAVALIRTGTARFEHLLNETNDAMDMEVHERLIVDGSLGQLREPLIHEDFKGLTAYIERHNYYSTWEAKVRCRNFGADGCAEHLVRGRMFGNLQERRRMLKRIAMRVPFEPLCWFVYHYIARLGFLEGRRGLIASQIRSQYIANVRAKQFEIKLQSQPAPAVASNGPLLSTEQTANE